MKSQFPDLGLTSAVVRIAEHLEGKDSWFQVLVFSLPRMNSTRCLQQYSYKILKFMKSRHSIGPVLQISRCEESLQPGCCALHTLQCCECCDVVH